MKKFFNKTLSLGSFWIALFVTLPAIAFLLKPGIYWNMHDDMQMVRQLEMEKCFYDGQFPCRWSPDLGYGYGYPLFNFYPPLPYLIGQPFRLLGFSFMTTIKIVAILQFLLSSLGIFLLVKSLLGPLPGILSSILYTYAPYHFVNIYVRGAMNEAWASVFFPYIFYYIYLYFSDKKVVRLFGISLCYAFLLLSHNPMVLIFSPLIALWSLVLYLKDRKISFLIHIFISLFYGIMLSSFFTLPVVFESKLVQIETMFTNYYHYSQHFISLFQIFISTFWGDGPSRWGTNDGMSFSIGHFHWIISLIITFYYLFIFYKKKSLTNKEIYFFFFSFVGLAYLFLTHEKSTFIWQILTPLQKIQFPWRILNVVTFLFSLSGAYLIYIIPPKHRPFSLLILYLGILIFNWNHLKPVTFGPITDKQKFEGQAWVNQVTGGIYDYLPKTAPTAAKSPAKEFVDQIIPEQNYQLSGQKKGTDWLFFNLYLSKDSNITLPILFFPNFTVSNNGQPIEISPDPILGRISFNLTSGTHQIYVKIHNTPIRTISNFISLFSLLILIPLWKLLKSKL